MKTHIPFSLVIILLCSIAFAECNCEQSDLIVGQSTPVGFVDVCTTENGKMAVYFVITDPNWFLVKTHVSAEEDPDDITKRNFTRLIEKIKNSKGFARFWNTDRLLKILMRNAVPKPEKFEYIHVYFPDYYDQDTLVTISDPIFVDNFQYDTVINIAAHAVVAKHLNTDVPEEPYVLFTQEVWADGMPFIDGKKPAYFEYYFEECGFNIILQ